MNEAHGAASRQILLSALWPAISPPHSQTWAILDGARDPRIHEALATSHQPKCCLFAGELSSDLRKAAPYLVQLTQGERLTQTILETGWGRQWGVFLRSNASIESLQKHFRQFLRVKDEQGKFMHFRYYDPRVLRVYLPTCTPEELSALFSGVERFVTEAKSGREAEQFQFTGWRLQASHILLAQEAGSVTVRPDGAGAHQDSAYTDIAYTDSAHGNNAVARQVGIS